MRIRFVTSPTSRRQDEVYPLARKGIDPTSEHEYRLLVPKALLDKRLECFVNQREIVVVCQTEVGGSIINPIDVWYFHGEESLDPSLLDTQPKSPRVQLVTGTVFDEPELVYADSNRNFAIGFRFFQFGKGEVVCFVDSLLWRKRRHLFSPGHILHLEGEVFEEDASVAVQEAWFNRNPEH